MTTSTFGKLYLFAITHAQLPPQQFDQLADIDPTNSPFGITEGALQAIVCHADPSSIQTAIQTGNRTQLEAFVLRHDRIISALMTHTTVLPLSFGTLLDSETIVRQLLALNQVAWGEMLDNLEGCVEMGLKAYVDDTSLLQHLPIPDAPAVNNGATYLLQRKFELERQRTAEQYCNQTLEKIHTACSALARQALLKPIEGQLAQEDDLALRSIYLIHRDHVKPLRQLVEQLNDEWEDWLELALDGPFAPYHFVGTPS